MEPCNGPLLCRRVGAVVSQEDAGLVEDRTEDEGEGGPD